MLLPTALRKSCIYQILSFIVSRDISPIRNKVLDREFCWSVNDEIYSRLKIWNCTLVWSADKFVWKLISLRKNESSLEKRKQFHWRVFFSNKSISILQESLQDERIDKKFSYQMLPWISCKVTQRCINVHVGGSFSLTNKSNLIVILFKIKDISEMGNKIHEWKKLFTKSDMFFFEFWSKVRSHYPVKFDVHRTCGIWEITFFICHETTYNHVLEESCDFVSGGPILSSLVVMSHVKTEI